jgi:hypothetical protein
VRDNVQRVVRPQPEMRAGEGVCATYVDCAMMLYTRMKP